MFLGQQRCSIVVVTAGAEGGFRVAGRARGAHGAWGKAEAGTIRGTGRDAGAVWMEARTGPGPSCTTASVVHQGSAWPEISKIFRQSPERCDRHEADGTGGVPRWPVGPLGS